MASISSSIYYILTFLSVYVQVFFLVTFFENRESILTRKGSIKLTKYPAVTIIVPCWNEEQTIYKTVRSLLDLNYPQEKVKIFLVDDGSTDGTWAAIEKFKKYPNIQVFKKENGGKFTALNLGLAHVETEFLGCLDADSVAHSESLIRIMSYFEEDKTAMAVSPSIVVTKPTNIIQNAQRFEYYMGVFNKKMLAFMGAIHVTPGPLTIFRKKVFNDLGPYRHAHNTEDMEIAYRMQKNYYPIAHCHDAYVYTNTPTTVRKLYKQRLRWIYGFINNTIDYRNLVLKKKYGNFSLFTLPAGIMTVFAVSFLFGRTVYAIYKFFALKVMEFQTVGFHYAVSGMHFDSFFINIPSVFWVTLFIYCSVTLSIVIGRKMAEGTWAVSLDMLYFFFVFAIVAPFWLLTAVYDTLFSRSPSWR